MSTLFIFAADEPQLTQEETEALFSACTLGDSKAVRNILETLREKCNEVSKRMRTPDHPRMDVDKIRNPDNVVCATTVSPFDLTVSMLQSWWLAGRAYTTPHSSVV